MILRWLHLALAGLLITCALPFLVVSMVIAGVGSILAVIFPALKHRRILCHTLRYAGVADEFGFEHAIKEYEALIDAHAKRP